MQVPFIATGYSGRSGWVRFANVYYGTIFRTQTIAVRDDETAQLSLDLPIGPGTGGFLMSGIARGAWIVSQDSRSVGLSSLKRGSGAVGVRLSELSDVSPNARSWQIEAFTGAEATTQLGVEATGSLVGGVATINHLNLDDWYISARGLGGWHKLDAARTNSDADVRIDLERSTLEGSVLTIGAGASTLRRQYFTKISGIPAPLAVENRNEDRIGSDFNLDYKINKVFSFGSVGMLQANSIQRSYGQAIADVPISAVSRTLAEFVVDIEGRLSLQLKQMNLMGGGSIFVRNESNTVAPLNSIGETELNTIRLQESQRDNTTSRLRLFARALWNPAERDTITAEWTWWLLRYDTPSDLNNDDRDELNALAKIRYSHTISELLIVGVSLSSQLLHTVFLRSTNSEQNNQNGVIRLSPFVFIRGAVVSMMPTFEVLANYTVYDFESQGATIRSYGYRKILYRDSVIIRFTPSMSFEIPSVVQYFETSTLLWSDFSELPSNGTLEYITKFLIFSRSQTAWEVGAGIRLYAFKQRRLMVPAGESSLTASVRSWAPEVDIRYSPSSGSTLILSGYYEFQTIEPNKKVEIPRLAMQARVAL
ncbi:MAG: hypothetical protein HYX66_03385 [Ignavibacteria bacterium]|nr:hypothetical protein [Ignavibacteria bacterium]